MPIAEVIAEVILRPFFECVLFVLLYWSGYFVLKVVSFGRASIAPFSDDKPTSRKSKRHKVDWSIYQGAKKHRMLKADFACLIGLLTWAGMGLFIYGFMR